VKHANIAIFIPHLGCGQSCSFCNQNVISGKLKAPTKEEVSGIIGDAISQNKNINRQNTEIAFFGGSFTAISPNYMLDLLTVAKKFIDSGQVKGIRISTRPDCINDDNLKLLKEYGVTSIEIGCQSLNDYVLRANLRGHTERDATNSAKKIKEYGFNLGLQMMVGLYKSSEETEIYTAKKFVELKPDTVRIYPTIIMPDTLLKELYDKREYEPLTLDRAVDISSKVLKIFYENGINVIKVGLHSDTSMENGYIVGPYHPAFRELCESRIYLNEMKKLLKCKSKGNYTFVVDKTLISKIIGQNRRNIIELQKDGYTVKILDKSRNIIFDDKTLIMGV